MPDTAGIVRACMAAQFQMDPGDIPDDASMDTLECWDSLAHLGLIERLETACGRTIPFEDAVTLISLPAIVAWLDGH